MSNNVDCRIQNASLGESIRAVSFSQSNFSFQMYSIDFNAGENETRKNPGQTSIRLFSESLSTSEDLIRLKAMNSDAYCQITMAGSILFHHINSTFSISHASTIVLEEPAFCEPIYSFPIVPKTACKPTIFHIVELIANRLSIARSITSWPT